MDVIGCAYQPVLFKDRSQECVTYLFVCASSKRVWWDTLQLLPEGLYQAEEVGQFLSLDEFRARLGECLNDLARPVQLVCAKLPEQLHKCFVVQLSKLVGGPGAWAVWCKVAAFLDHCCEDGR